MSPLTLDSLLMPGHLALAMLIIAGLAAAGYFTFPFLFDKGLSRAMQNGFGVQLGNLVALKVKEGNAEQTEAHALAVDKAVALNDVKLALVMKHHEEVEELRLRMALQEVKSEEHACAQQVLDRLELHDRRLGELESYLKGEAK